MRSKTAAHLLRAMLGIAALTIFGGLVAAQKPSTEQNPPKGFPLPELRDARSISVNHGRAYILEDADVAVYSLDNGRFLKKIGRRGQGPGEFTLLGNFSVLSDRLVAQDFTKLTFLSLEGVYQGQMLFPVGIRESPYMFLPIGKNYVGFPRERKPDGSSLPPTGSIYNAAGRFLRRFYSGISELGPPPPPPRGSSAPSGPKPDVLLIRDYVDYLVADNKIFVADSRKGLCISVFDEQGLLLYEIRHDMNRVKVPKNYLGAAYKSLKPEDKKYRDGIHAIVPEYFPAFVGFKIDGDRIYVITSDQKDGRYEILIMDLKGKLIDRQYRFPFSPNFAVPFAFRYKYDIYRGHIYYVIYNDQDERFELRIG